MSNNVNESKTPERIAQDFFLKQDIENLNNKIEGIKNFIERLVYKNDKLQSQFNELYDEKWSDKTLQNMQQELNRVKHDAYRGFPITFEENETINKWQERHDTEVHNNPKCYHGASGGGYIYEFIPTGLGVISRCICSACKQKALKKVGEKYWEELKKNDGFIEFGDFG